MASNKSNLRPIYRSANKLKHNIEYYVNQKVAKKLKESIITNVMTSFGPETTHGKEVKAFNDEQKELHGGYRKKLPYHRSRTLLSAIRVEIVGNEVLLIVDKIPYEDETGKRKTERTALNVFKYLNYGTRGGKRPYPFKVIQEATTVNGEEQKAKYAFAYSPKIEGRHFAEKTQQEVALYRDELMRQVANHTFRIRNRREK